MESSRARYVLALAGAALVASCSLLTNLDGYSCEGDCVDAGTDSPLGADTALVEASSSPDAGGAVDGDADASPDASPDADAGGRTYSCPGNAPVSDCASCPGAAFPCLLCASNGADSSKVLGICVTSATSGSACQGKGPAGYDDCLCSTQTDPSPCIEPYQICLAPYGPACRTCGYDGGAGLKCKSGGTCSASGACQ